MDVEEVEVKKIYSTKLQLLLQRNNKLMVCKPTKYLKQQQFCTNTSDFLALQSKIYKAVSQYFEISNRKSEIFNKAVCTKLHQFPESHLTITKNHYNCTDVTFFCKHLRFSLYFHSLLLFYRLKYSKINIWHNSETTFMLQ